MEEGTVEIWIDGGVSKRSEDSRGRGRYSSRAEAREKVIWDKVIEEDDMTSNEAEMKALIEAIKDAMAYVRIERAIMDRDTPEVIIYSDSQNVVSWFDGSFKCKAPNIRPLLDSANKLAHDLSLLNVRVLLKKIPREKNKAHNPLK